ELTQRLKALEQAQAPEREKQYQAAVQKIQELERENCRLRCLSSDYQQQAERVTLTYQQLQAEYQTAINRIQTLESEIQGLRKDCADFQKYAEDLESDNQLLKQQIKELQSRWWGPQPMTTNSPKTTANHSVVLNANEP
ncbi:MAG: hypothetical protein NZL92_09465, partial [Gloeomargarita sp. SKYG116]|nr:hypothetical protein [Gloeomargarita sp. SKYG116]MDW8401910.1 hypothetical protein [Gloeomargarita sp. SKYGB_i_bin116]